MKAFIEEIIKFLNGPESTAFQYGYLTGAAISILVVILLFLLFLLMRSSVKCKGVALASSGGKLYITASAIADLVKSTEKDFPSLQIIKTLLLEKREFLTLELRVNFPPDMQNGPLPVVAEALQQKIFEKLKTAFGIECVKEINIEVLHGKNKS